MLKVVTKKEYWAIEESGITSTIQPKNYLWHLKTIQDAVAWHELHQLRGKKIAEIGGGNSRVLPALAKENSCTNIDEFKGAGHGPTEAVETPDVRYVPARLGQFTPDLGEAEFDIIFSISVLEHIDDPDLPDFFADCARILKPHGTMLHLIDVYLSDARLGHPDVTARAHIYKRCFDSEYFVSPDPAQCLIPDSLVFSASFASNPDNVMQRWNQQAPRLREMREQRQSCAMYLAATRTSQPFARHNTKAPEVL